MLMWRITRGDQAYGVFHGSNELEAYVRMVFRVFGPIVLAKDGRLLWREPSYPAAIGLPAEYTVELVEDEGGEEYVLEAGGCMSCHDLPSRYDCHLCRLKLCTLCVAEHATRCG